MLFGKKKQERPDLSGMVSQLVRNQITLTLGEAASNADPCRSKLGGRPAVPADFKWPRFDGEDFDGEKADRPLSFLGQINLAEAVPYDTEHLLPKTGLLLFFYEQATMRWGFDPADQGCSRVCYFPGTEGLTEMELPEDLEEDYRVQEFDLTLQSESSYPCFDEAECLTGADFDWEEYDEAVEETGYEFLCERHKLLGYADLIQGEMLTECERTTRGLYCGDAESYQNTPKQLEQEIAAAAKDWVLLFQMASIEEDGYELMFGDLGNLYFYIRKQDLAAGRFDRVWMILQCS